MNTDQMLSLLSLLNRRLHDIAILMSHYMTLFIAQLHFILYNWGWMMFHPKHVWLNNMNFKNIVWFIKAIIITIIIIIIVTMLMMMVMNMMMMMKMMMKKKRIGRKELEGWGMSTVGIDQSCISLYKKQVLPVTCGFHYQDHNALVI